MGIDVGETHVIYRVLHLLTSENHIQKVFIGLRVSRPIEKLLAVFFIPADYAIHEVIGTSRGLLLTLGSRCQSIR